MKDVADKLFFTLGVLGALIIVFVRAGQYGGATGGTQSAQIIKAGGSATSSVFGTVTGK